MLGFVKGTGAFMLGGAATLFFEQYIFPDGAPMIILYAAMAFGAGLMIFGYGPKVWYLWWLKRQKPMTFDLQIVELSSLYRVRVLYGIDSRGFVH